MIVLYNNENPEFDEFTINTYGTKRPEADESVVMRVGRDPTMYIPGHEDKPDPDSSSVLMITDGATSTRQNGEDPPLKTKRDHRYVEGDDDYGNYTEELETSNRKPRREPTMYVNDEATEPDTFMTDRSNRSSDPYGMNDIDDMSGYYGGYEGMNQESHLNSSGRDPSIYLDDFSNNKSPSRSKKKKKKTRQYQ